MPRGGFRSNAGRKKKSKEQKILEGTYKEHAISTENLPAPVIRIEVVDNDVPSLKEYMTRTQKNGNKLQVGDEYKRALEWIKNSGCSAFVPANLIEQYVMNRCRYIELQNAVSDYGYIVKKGINGNIQPNPLFQLLFEQEKMMNASYDKIDAIIRQNTVGNTVTTDEVGKKMLSIMGITRR